MREIHVCSKASKIEENFQSNFQKFAKIEKLKIFSLYTVELHIREFSNELPIIPILSSNQLAKI